MNFLYEQLEVLRKTKNIKAMPKYIKNNLNPKFELRKYQYEAFENFITYFENEGLRQKPTNTLFHMATGSGKTLIMSGLILYLYNKGYRNFLFFVNRDNIVNKTKINFLDASSSKYLFADEININGEKIKINEVNNFQNVNSDDINICFTTIQSLHLNLNFAKENNLTFDDFKDKKIVLISDEAHHLNSFTKKIRKQKLSKEEELTEFSWEHTVNRIFGLNNENVMLEFTATCDLEDENIKVKYENKIVYDYPLYNFRQDGYSKEIITLRTDLNIMERSIIAITLSQYRLKVFNDNKLNVKPVILFKSDKIENSKLNQEIFLNIIKNLDGKELERILNLVDSELVRRIKDYLHKNNISFNSLAQELKDSFNEGTSLNTNDNKDENKMQILLNSLEDRDNPYRAIFTVDKLNEGWDVLNLFDIVRLYETRQGGRNKVSKTTISEAQLIGRGARYYPFKVEDNQELYKRKYDEDVLNDLRICEELHYHCQNDSKYIHELHQALKEIGIDLDNTIDVNYILKDSFKSDVLYKQGIVFKNERRLKSRKSIESLKASVKDRIYTINIEKGNLIEDKIFADNINESNSKSKRNIIKIKDIAECNYALINKAICKYPIFKFNTLSSYYPNLKSTKEFITSDDYLGNIKLEILHNSDILSNKDIFDAVVIFLGKIATNTYDTEEVYEGTKEFKAIRINEVFKNKVLHFTKIVDNGIGTSQNESTIHKLDLLKEDWYVYNDNYGTKEEKSFVAYFEKYIENLNTKYDKVYLLRNERHLAIYSFADGERFEPDYLLLLQKQNNDNIEQLQIFIEPKGTHLLEKDKWKEEFLLSLQKDSIPVIKFVDDNKYNIWGFNFYNEDNRMSEFKKDIEKLI